MAIKKVSKESIEYTPAYGGNRESSNPLTVMITPIARGQSDAYAKQTRYYQKKGFRGEWESNSLQVQRRQFLENTQSVNNFLDDDGTEITDTSRFYEEAPYDLIEEILTVILDASQLEDQERKNS